MVLHTQLLDQSTTDRGEWFCDACNEVMRSTLDGPACWNDTCEEYFLREVAK